jgi:hypothetical protein
MMSTLWILGAADPEMMAVESALRAAGLDYAYAAADGKRCHGGNAYRATGVIPNSPAVSFDTTGFARIILVECEMPGWWGGDSGDPDHPAPVVIKVDHHRPGDPGYDRPPQEFLPASSLGQVLGLLHEGRWEYAEWRHCGQHWALTKLGLPFYFASSMDRLIVAADHCLAAAYRGRCPGVNPDDLMRWRAETRATYQKRPVGAILADVAEARHVLLSAALCEQCKGAADFHRTTGDKPVCGSCGGLCHLPQYVDLRDRHIPELPEAACREGIPYITTVKDPDGREKVVLGAAPPELVRRFLAGELVPGLIDYYGSPERGLAGGYLS